MNRLVPLAVIASIVLVMGTATALTLQPAATGVAWQGTWVADENGNPYWDGNSSDYTQPGNIGNFIAGSGAFTAHPQSPNNPSMPYLEGQGANAGPNGMPIDVYFQSATPNWAALKIEVAGLSNWNYFGIYKQGDLPSNLDELLTTPPGSLGLSGKSMLLFKGTDGPGASLTFVSPWTDFGFYLATEDSANPGSVLRAFFSESTLNTGTEYGKQHFAFFQAKTGAYPAYYIGAEDLPLSSSDKDYNDLVVYIQAIPDASTWMLFLSGVPALALLRRRRA